MQTISRYALLALVFSGCLVPACAPVHVHVPPAQSAHTVADAAPDDGERMGSVAVKNASGATITLKSRTDGADEVPMHDIGVITAGDNNIGNVDVVTLPAIPAGTNNIGDIDVASIAAGDNNVGNVDVVTLPALVAGTANIGDVDVLTLPALAAGTNNIGDVDVLTLPALAAGTNNIGDVDVLTLPALVAGTATIGAVLNATPGVTVALNDVATNVSSNSGELDWSVYSGVWVACTFDGASAAAGTIQVWGCLETGSCTSGSAAERAYLLADVLHDTQITQTVAGDNELDVAYSAEGTQRVSFHIQTPKPFNAIKWTRTSGGDADGLTCRVFARAL